jgi:hypothetical protein
MQCSENSADREAYELEGCKLSGLDAEQGGGPTARKRRTGAISGGLADPGWQLGKQIFLHAKAASTFYHRPDG